MLSQNPFNLVQEVLNQIDDRLELIGSARLLFGSVPMIVRDRFGLVPTANRRAGMGVIEPQSRVPSGACNVKLYDRP